MTKLEDKLIASVNKTPAQRNSKVDVVFLDKPNGKPDSLEEISGIGAVLKVKLNELGIYHFYQIAAFSTGDIARVDDKLNFKGRIERESWVAQAKEKSKLTASSKKQAQAKSKSTVSTKKQTQAKPKPVVSTKKQAQVKPKPVVASAKKQTQVKPKSAASAKKKTQEKPKLVVNSKKQTGSKSKTKKVISKAKKAQSSIYFHSNRVWPD